MREAVRSATGPLSASALLVQGTALATRRDLVAETRNDEMTLAMAVRPPPRSAKARRPILAQRKPAARLRTH